MVNKNCCFANCRSSSRKKIPGIIFLPFPKPKTQPKKAKRWCYLTGRADFTVDNITKYTYVCNLHFPKGANLDMKDNPTLEPRSARLKTFYVPIEPIVREAEEAVRKEQKEKDSMDLTRWNGPVKMYGRPPGEEATGEIEPNAVIQTEQEFLTEAMETLNELPYLSTVAMGKEWILIQRNKFDVFLDQQPYQALQILVNVTTKLYLVRVWGQTFDEGVVSTTEDLRNICIRKFDFHSVCKGLETRVNEDLIHVEYPASRYVSRECKEFFQVVLGHSFKKHDYSANLHGRVSICGPCSKNQYIRETATQYSRSPRVQKASGETQKKSESHKDEETQEDPGLLQKIKCEVEEDEDANLDSFDTEVNLAESMQPSELLKIERMAKVEVEEHGIDCPTEDDGKEVTVNIGSLDDTEEFRANVIKTQEEDRRKKQLMYYQKASTKKPSKVKNQDKTSSVKEKVQQPENPSKPDLLNKVKILEKGPVDSDIPIEFRAETLLCKCGKFADKISEKRLDSQPPTDGDKETMITGNQKVEEMFHCGECNTKFMRVKMLLKKPKPKKKIKVALTIPERIYTCKICHEKFNDVSQYVDHHQIHASDREPDEVEVFTCSLCGLCTDSERKLQTHHRKTHPDVPFTRISSPIYICDLCGKDVMNKPSVIALHMAKAHNSGHKCPQCDKAFESLARLARHQLLHNEPSIPCTTCGKLFRTEHKVKDHEGKVHNLKDRIDVVCEICNQRFINKVSFNRHIRQHHPDCLHLIVTKDPNRKRKMLEKEEEEKKRRREQERNELEQAIDGLHQEYFG